MKGKIALFISLISMAIVSCEEGTGTIGIFPETDGINNSHAVYQLYSRSIPMGAVLASSDACYLGSVADPETGASITSNFAAQFHVFEDYSLPDKSTMTTDGAGEVIADSAEIRIYFESYYGKGDEPMKLEVYPLSSSKILEEGTTFYSDVDLMQYVEPGIEPIATKVFTPKDFILGEGELNSSNHTDNIRISLPKDFANTVLRKYYSHPEYFRDSYSFIRQVCPGFFFRISNGDGVMLRAEVSTMNIYFTAHETDKPTQTYVGIARFAATPEVIQCSQYNNSGLEELLNDNSCTYLKTPAGICTELTLPIEEIFSGHETDSISKARLTLSCYQESEQNKRTNIPSEVLLVRKDSLQVFFQERRVSNNKTSYTAAFDAVYNTYTFDNLCRLISHCKREKTQKAAAAGITEEQWMAENPNWNRVVVIPVKTSTVKDANGSSIQNSVTHDMSISSVRLVGGPSSPIKMQIIYSTFSR